jgi:hypothetical protein
MAYNTSQELGPQESIQDDQLTVAQHHQKSETTATPEPERAPSERKTQGGRPSTSQSNPSEVADQRNPLAPHRPSPQERVTTFPAPTTGRRTQRPPQASAQTRRRAARTRGPGTGRAECAALRWLGAARECAPAASARLGRWAGASLGWVG